MEDGQRKKIIVHIQKKNGVIMIIWLRGLGNRGYDPKTSMENLIMMIFGYYEDSDEIRERGYFGIQDTRKYPDNLMVNIPDIEEYVIASGGLEVFDFEI